MACASASASSSSSLSDSLTNALFMAFIVRAAADLCPGDTVIQGKGPIAVSETTVSCVPRTPFCRIMPTNTTSVPP
jgi:hypothetical protein